MTAAVRLLRLPLGALALLLALAAVAPPRAAAQPQAPNSRRVFENWMGEAIRLENGNTFAVCRTRENSRPNAELQMVKRVGDCANSSLCIYIADASPEGRQAGKQPVRGQLQVDSLTTHAIEADYFAEPGSKYFACWVRLYDNPRAVMQELASGQSVRVSFVLNQREHAFQFSLRGYGPSYEHIKQLCAAPPTAQAKPKPPSGASQGAQKHKAPSKNSDADFFPGPSGGSKSDKDYF